MLAAWAEQVTLSWGWRRRLLAFGAGGLGALALPPLGLWPLIVLVFAVPVWLLDGVAAPRWPQRLRAAFADGWWWGFGYGVAGLWWLGSAFLVQPEKFAWALPLGVLGLPAVLALFPAVGFALAQALWRPGAGRLFVLAGALGLSELARGHLFTGFPWNAYGQMLAENLWLAQSAAWWGLYGLTVVTVLLGAAPAVALSLPRRAAVGLSGSAFAALAVLLLAGWWRVPTEPSPLVAGVQLRIMQPNLAQDDKFRPERGRDILQRYLALSDSARSPQRRGVQDVTHLIWPESAFPFLLGRTPQALQMITAFLPAHVTLVTGAARAGVSLPGESNAPIYNAIQVITRAGGIIASYDKHHLVPFGEYVPGPFQAALDLLGVGAFVAIPGGFAAAPQRTSLAVPGLPPVAASICYEAIFPGEVLPHADTAARPHLLLNVTNDAWFGLTSGPHQHARQARLRAIEEGMPLVRAANNGISMVVDAHGRTVAALPLGVDGVLDAGLPTAIGPTTFSRVGNGVAVGLVVLSLLLGASLRRRSMDSTKLRRSPP